MSPAWTFALARLAGALLLAVALGLIFGEIRLWLTIVLGGMLTWQLLNLFRLQRWLRHHSQEDPPDLSGVWGEVVALIGRIDRRKLYHKRRVMQLLREFRRLSSVLPDGVVLLSSGREIIWFNRAAALMLGLRRKADRGMPIENLVRQPEFSQYLKDPGSGAGVVVRMRDGERSLSLIVIPAGEQLLMLARDVTHEARVEQMRKDFVANASHELRSPLTVIAGYVDQLGDENNLGSEWREPVIDMRQQTGRMREIVNDLLELSRLEVSADEAPLLPVDVPGLIDQLVREAKAGIPAPPRFELDLDRGCRLMGSVREIHSVAANLISNAVKFTPATGLITVRWARDQDGAHLAVADTGIGIAREHLPRLTERFYRVDRARARASGGSGLGLAIVKHALQRHGGRLEVESVEDQGSTFTAHFPARRLAIVSDASVVSRADAIL